MRLIFAGVGALQSKDALDTAAQEYAQRLTHYTRFELKTVDAAVAKAQTAATAQLLEAQRLRKVFPPKARVVALHETGRMWTTLQLSNRLQMWLNAGQDVVVIQGGPSGLDAQLLGDAAEQWSLSGLTLPHRMARAVALEALYRAFTVLAGEPYHRA